VDEELSKGLLPDGSALAINEAAPDRPFYCGVSFGGADAEVLGEPRKRPLAWGGIDEPEGDQDVLRFQHWVYDIRESRIAQAFEG
jgi:hypothetical protein